ncbi:SET domain-containing protein [Fretibacter rubidus]|uniref:SET domain-containing protein n=1 Tax=Fretibacter rubidus TaxID=570162 RepID=UPI00352B64F0
MFTPHKNDHPHVTVRTTTKGRGVFATRPISKGSVIAEFVGEVFTSDYASTLPAVMVDHAMQIGPRDYVHAAGRLAEILNHSCDPNCGVSGLTQIVTRYDIAAGTELCWDYAMSEMSDWRMSACQCGAAQCRETVGSFAILPETAKTQYLREGIVSNWIKDAVSRG